jgi:hypothetical protein
LTDELRDHALHRYAFIQTRFAHHELATRVRQVLDKIVAD